MRNDIRQSNLELGPKLAERYVDRAHQLRREYIRRSVRQSLARLHRAFQWSLARTGGVFHLITGKEARARGDC